MTESTANQFDPDYAIHAGEILQETLEARGIKQSAFARRCGLSTKTISQIIHGKEPVTPETAIKFERVLGVSAAVWNNLEAMYRLHMAQKSAREEIKKQKAWARRFPLKELVKRGIIGQPKSDADAAEKLLDFFGVGSIAACEARSQEMAVAYRQSPSFESAPESVAAWLRIAELIAEGIDTAPYSKKKFSLALEKIRKLTIYPPEVFEPKMKEMCRNAGVALVFVSELPKTHLSGATRWLHKDKALIMLSLRHKSDDHFWFSFFHEAAHVLYHGKKKIFLDEKDMEMSDEERAADRFASAILIPENEYRMLVQQTRLTKNMIRAFADRVGIAPGIVVGRLQHDGKVPYGWFNGLRRKFELVECTP